jgi:hypothetical protein
MPNDRYHHKNKGSNGNCKLNIVFDYYNDQKTGCRSMRKIKLTKCQGQCSASSALSTSRDIRTINTNNKQLNLIGSNIKPLFNTNLRSLNPFYHNIQKRDELEKEEEDNNLCKSVNVKKRKLRLVCQDGSTFTTFVDQIKECACGT